MFVNKNGLKHEKKSGSFWFMLDLCSAREEVLARELARLGSLKLAKSSARLEPRFSGS